MASFKSTVITCCFIVGSYLFKLEMDSRRGLLADMLEQYQLKVKQLPEGKVGCKELEDLHHTILLYNQRYFIMKAVIYCSLAFISFVFPRYSWMSMGAFPMSIFAFGSLYNMFRMVGQESDKWCPRNSM